MSFKSFLKEILGIKRVEKKDIFDSVDVVNSNQQLSTEINRKYQKMSESPNFVPERDEAPSTAINSYQQKSTEKFNTRDLMYARRIGQIEKIAMDISDIKEKVLGLDIKFDLRVPDRVLTEEKFKKEIDESSDIFKEIEELKKSIERLERIITNNQQSSPIITSSVKPLLEKDSKEFKEDYKEKVILNALKNQKLTAEELGRKINLSRSRTNQILLELKKKGLVSRIKFGKKYLWMLK